MSAASLAVRFVAVVALDALFIVLDLPDRPRGGVDLRALQVAAALGTWGRVGVFGLVKRSYEPPSIEGIDIWTTTSDPYLTESAPGASDLEWMGIDGALPTDRYFSQLAASEIADLIDTHSPSTVVIDQLWLHGYVEVARSRGARVVLDHHNAETALQRRLAAGVEGPERIIRRSLTKRVAAAEARTLGIVDQVWVCSEVDRDTIAAEFAPPAHLSIVPNAVDVEAYAAARDHSAAREVGLVHHPRRVLYPANFAYLPNVRAGRFLIDALFPLIVADHPDAELVLAGRSPSPELRSADRSRRGVTVTGEVASMVPYLAAAGVMVVPLSEGSGTRIKILEAFASGLPVVSTPIGAEGLPVSPGVDILIAETASGLVSAVGALWADPAGASRQAAAAFDLVREELSWEVTAQAVRRALDG